MELNRNRQSFFSPLTPFVRLPKLFNSEWSYAQYRLPAQPPSSNLAALSTQATDPTADRVDEERCTVAWIEVPSTTPTLPSPSPISPTNPGKVTRSTSSHPVKPIATPPGPTPATEYQLVALTYSGGWYRLSLPPAAGTATPGESRPGTPTGGRPGGSTLSSSPKDASVLSGMGWRGKGTEAAGKGVDKGKGKEKEEPEGKGKGKEEPEGKGKGKADPEVKEKQSRQCVLEEFRRFGRWDGWG